MRLQIIIIICEAIHSHFVPESHLEIGRAESSSESGDDSGESASYTATPELATPHRRPPHGQTAAEHWEVPCGTNRKEKKKSVNLN